MLRRRLEVSSNAYRDGQAQASKQATRYVTMIGLLQSVPAAASDTLAPKHKTEIAGNQGDAGHNLAYGE